MWLKVIKGNILYVDSAVPVTFILEIEGNHSESEPNNPYNFITEFHWLVVTMELLSSFDKVKLICVWNDFCNLGTKHILCHLLTLWKEQTCLILEEGNDRFTFVLSQPPSSPVKNGLFLPCQWKLTPLRWYYGAEPSKSLVYNQKSNEKSADVANAMRFLNDNIKTINKLVLSMNDWLSLSYLHVDNGCSHFHKGSVENPYPECR